MVERNIPFHVAVSENYSLAGFIMVEQVKSVEFRSRRIRFVEEVALQTFKEVLAILDAMLYQ